MGWDSGDRIPPGKKARRLPAPRLLLLEQCSAYFGVPCTASVTTARVSEGASISRKVYT